MPFNVIIKQVYHRKAVSKLEDHTCISYEKRRAQESVMDKTERLKYHKEISLEESSEKCEEQLPQMRIYMKRIDSPQLF